MINQVIDQNQVMSMAQQIIAQIPTCLSQSGLLAKFKRWRLVQDSKTGMVVLFGILDKEYITRHTETLFSDYFDPCLLRDLTTELKVPVTSSSNDGLRYTFILDRGLLDFPNDMEDDHSLIHKRLDKFLRITSDTALEKSAANQHLPDVLFMDEAEFNQQMAEYETNHHLNQSLQV